MTFPHSYILLPGHDPKSLEVAANSGADLVVFDFEDMVPMDQKPKARLRVRTWLETEDLDDVEVGVRVNAWDSGVDHVDRTALAGLDLVHVVLPKIESAAQVDTITDALTKAGVGSPLVHVIIETPAAVEAVSDIVAAGPSSLLVGAFDLGKALGVEPDPNTPELLSARQRVADAAKAAGVAALDMPFVDVGNAAGFQAHIEQAWQFGFTGCCAMNASQAAEINARFGTPSTTH